MMNMKNQVRALEAEDMKPMICFDESELKEVKNFEVGKSYEVKLKIKMVSKEEDLEEGIEGEFEVQKVSVI